MTDNLIALQNRFLGRGETVYDRLATLREESGALSSADIQALADEANLPAALVRSVAKFYDDFREETVARHTLKVCNGEACVVDGAHDCRSRLQVALPGDDQLAAGEITCLGYCGLGPMAMLEEPGGHRVLSLRGREEAVVAALLGGEPVDDEEPTNAVVKADGAANVLLSRFGHALADLATARAAGVYGAFEAALKEDAQAVIDEVKAAQLRGRGGAGFPAGIKLATVRGAPGGPKVVVVNADEGDAGAFIDKELLEQAPHSVLEGTLLAAYASGASEGYLYLRAEYPKARAIVAKALADAEAAGLLGERILGSDFSFRLKLIDGHGAYICGEETSLLRSLEGVAAQVSPKPPYPAIEGFRGRPTLVNNVETLANLPWIVEHGGEAYAALGEGRSRGTKLLSISGAVARPGLFEVELGVPLRDVLSRAGGMAGGKTFHAMQIGGPLGGIFGEQHLDLPLTFEALAEAGGMLGHGGIVVYDRDVDLVQIGRGLMKFCAVESCGKCFPCRIGSVRGTELFDKILDGRGTQADLELLAELNETMALGSLCMLGGGIPIPIQNLMSSFIDDFRKHIPGARTPALAREKLT